MLRESDDPGTKGRAQDERQVRVFGVDALIAHIAVAAHDGARARVDTRRLNVGDHAIDRQRLVRGDFDERTERRRRVQLQSLGEKLRRR